METSRLVFRQSAGSSNYFLGGLTAYTIEQKVGLIGVEREHAASVNCVSRQVAEQMAAGVRKLFGSFVGISTTGYAERWIDGGIEKPFAFYSIDIGGWVKAGRIDGGERTRVEVQQFVTDAVIKQLIESFRTLQQLRNPPTELASVQRQLRNIEI